MDGRPARGVRIALARPGRRCELVVELARRIALAEQTFERNEPVGRVQRAERLGLERVDELGADPRLALRDLREGTRGLVLDRARRLGTHPVARHAQDAVLPVLKLSEARHVVDIDLERPREARRPPSRPPTREVDQRVQRRVAAGPARLRGCAPERHFHGCDAARPPHRIVLGPFHDTEQDFLDIVSQVFHRRRSVHVGRPPRQAPTGSFSAPDLPSHGAPASADPLLAQLATVAAARDAAMAPAWRRRHGVVHTPAAVATHIVARVDEALRTVLGLEGGVGDPRVVLVDPATGPGVFLGAAMAHARLGTAPRAAVGLDLDADALARAHAVLGPAAVARGWPLALVCGDALASFAPCPALEDHDVARVVLGNPPWASRSAQGDGAPSHAWLDDFRRGADGEPLGERKIGVLSDDYVRFLRWGAELVRTATRGGVLAMVTNGSYLDGPVHRGMRAALRRWFDRLDVIDLGGSALIARDGQPDENVFGVRPSAALLVAVRRPGPEPRQGHLHTVRVRGHRDEKLAWLSAAPTSLRATPAAPEARWADVPRIAAPDYAGWPSLADWMPFHREGLQSNRDPLVVADDLDALRARLTAFAEGRVPLRSTAHWSEPAGRALARGLLETRGALEASVVPLAYRPLDTRMALVHPGLCHRPRPELAAAVARSRWTLVSTRKDRGERAWTHFGATLEIPDNCWLSTRSSCRARAFPLRGPDGQPNLGAALAARAEHALGHPLDGEAFGAWALAWMASESYRTTFDHALREAPPRIPVPWSAEALASGERVGRALVRALLDPPSRCFDGVLALEAPEGSLRVEGSSIRRGREVVARDVPPEALGLILGHHAPVLGWLAAHPRDAAGFATVVDRAVSVASAIADAERVIGPWVKARSGAPTRRGA